MSDNTPDEPTAPPVVQPPAAYDPVASANTSYDPMPLEVADAQSRNWLGIVALITGIIGFSVAAIVFGILGLNAVKQRKATNRGLNIAGIVLGAIGLVIEIAVVAALVIFAGKITDAVSDALTPNVGDCYVSTVTSTDTLENFNPIFGACTDATNAEVYYITTYTGTASPGDDGFTDELLSLCTSDTAVAKVNGDAAADYYVEYYLPASTINNWADSNKTVVCSLSKDTGPVGDDVINE